MIPISSRVTSCPAPESPPPVKCPKCGGEILDLRGAGFNATAVEAEGRCFAWGADSYTCLHPPRLKARDCCCGVEMPNGYTHPTPCHACRAANNECECCGASALGSAYYPYGTYCKACGDDVSHPTGYGQCYVADGKEHRCWPEPQADDDDERVLPWGVGVNERLVLDSWWEGTTLAVTFDDDVVRFEKAQLLQFADGSIAQLRFERIQDPPPRMKVVPLVRPGGS